MYDMYPEGGPRPHDPEPALAAAVLAAHRRAPHRWEAEPTPDHPVAGDDPQPAGS